MTAFSLANRGLILTALLAATSARAATAAAETATTPPAATTPEAAPAAAPATTTTAVVPPAAVPPAVAAPPPAPADPLDGARSKITAGKSDDALKDLDGLATKMSGDRLTLARVQALRAEVLLTRRKPDENRAREAVIASLRADPAGVAFENAPGRLLTLLDAVRSEQVVLSHQPPTGECPDLPVKLRVRAIDGARQIHDLSGFVRGVGQQSYTARKLQTERGGGGQYAAFVPDLRLLTNTASGPVRLEYYFVAKSDTGAVLDTLGSEQKPLSALLDGAPPKALTEVELVEPSVAPPPPAPPAWYQQTKYQVAVGVGAAAVIGGIVTAIVMTQPDPLPSTLATVTVP